MILLIHGAGAGAWEWAIWQRAFAAENLQYNAINLQPSSAGLAATRYEDYLAQVEQGICLQQPSAVIGASLGGLLAAEALAKSPSNAKLVLLAPAGNRCVVDPAQSPPIISQLKYSEIKRWANDPQLARTARALPDADAASIWQAHASWRDESAAVLRQAHAGRSFSWLTRSSLMIAAAQDSDVSNEVLASWAQQDDMAYWLIQGASHAGLLLGQNAGVLAQRVIQWLKA
jgi:pimeloyl-ACP methyl ester carboxylesterase